MDYDENDKELFKKAMQNVTPLKKSNKKAHEKSQAKIRTKRSHEFTDIAFALSDHMDEVITNEQFLSFKVDGISERYFKLLKQGKKPVEAELDLHGCTVNEARELYSKFIAHSQAQGHRVVRIIHGKGHRSQVKKPVLKTCVYSWLQQTPNILAFCSCTVQDGGTGALYVLLKRPTPENNS